MKPALEKSIPMDEGEIVTCDPNRPDRRSIRLQNYDYSQPGAYFVTICTKDRKLFFQNANVCLMVEKWWCRINDKFENMETDEFVVMPNHIHGIIFINVGAHPCVRPLINDINLGPTHRSAPTENVHQDLKKVSLGRVIQWFKTMTTNEYIRRVKLDHWESFSKNLWQRNYWEHVVRNEHALEAVRRYILQNPMRWDKDRYNANASGIDPMAKELWQILKSSNR